MSASDSSARLEALLEVMLAIARQDFEVRAPVGPEADAIDAIAVGLNMLAEELRGEVTSRRELERAHTELQQTQARLVHAGKLAAIGQLAAGIAHEINNPIQGVQICLSIVRRTQEQLLDALVEGTLDVEQARRRLSRTTASIDDAFEAIERVRGVTSSLRTFARIDDAPLTRVDLADVIGVSVRLSESTARIRARIVLELADVPPVHGSRGRLGQVVTNLIVNAIQAIPEGATAAHVIRIGLALEAEWVVLTVDDSGVGIPPADRERVFSAFFTTKAAELGTGLGLSLVAEIVRAHGGSISASESTLGGARFEVRLPAMAGATRAPSSEPRPRSLGRRRVLIVDDEPMLLRLLGIVLSEQCDVVTASSGEVALELVRRGPAFDVVICDLGMPGMDGVAVYEALTELEPTLRSRFVFATGGATTTKARVFLEQTTERTLQKPFEVATLLTLISQ